MTKFNRVASTNIRLTSGKPNFNFVGRLSVRNLRIAFQITKSLSWSTNTASIQIYNLSSEKRARLKDYGDEVSLYAGYSEEAGEQILFIGDTTRVSHLYEQPEIITTLECGDGERILNQRITTISYGPNTPARSVISGIAEKMGISISVFAATQNIIYEQGFQFTGMAKDGLDKVCQYLGLTWSIQNNALQLIQNNSSTSKPPAQIDQNTGMIGVPQRYTYKRRDLFRAGPKQGWKVQTLLRPEILPGDRVRLVSQQADVDDLFFVDSVKHRGDTHGQPWTSDWELIRV